MNNFDTKGLKRSVVTYISIAMVLLALTTVIATAIIQNYRQDEREKEYSSRVHQSINHAINHYIKEYSYLVRRITETTDIVDLIKKKDRDGLYKMLEGKWKLMQEEEEYLKVMQIHLADGKSFLRMHKKEKYGDSLLDVRPMMKEIYTHHKMIKGYETGRYVDAYRVIYPIFDKQKKYIGAIELGLNPNFILHAVHDMNGICGIIFIKEDFLKLHFNTRNIVIDGYHLQSKLNKKLLAICGRLEAPNHLENNIQIATGDQKYLTHLFTLKDFKGADKVKMIFFQDITKAGIFRGYLLVGLSLFILTTLLILIWFVYRRICLYQNGVETVYKQQIDKIDESENRFRLLYEKAPNAYQSLDINGDLIIVNVKWCEELGYSKDEVIRHNFADFLVEKDKKRFKDSFSIFKEIGTASEIEFEMICKDGEHIIVEFNGKIIYNEDASVSYTQCTFVNITRQRQLEKEFNFNQNYLQTIFNVTPNIMITTDGEEIDRTNPAMLEFFGFKSTAEFKKEHNCICDYFLDSDECLSSVEDGMSWLEYMLKYKDKLHKVCMKKDNKRYVFVVHAEKLMIDDKHRSLVIFTDVTEIQDISQRLEYAVNGISDGIWDWNIQENKVYFSPRWKSMLGYEDTEITNSFRSWELLVHPDDIKQVTKEIQKSHNSADYIYENIHRLLHKDGHWVWILTRGQTIFDKDGKAIRMVGFHKDITKEKELEIQLRENERVYLDFFEYTKSANIIYSTDDDGETFVIKSLNIMVEKLENIKREDVVGKRVDDVFESVDKFGLLSIFRDVYKTATPQKMPITFYEDTKIKGWRENYIFKLSNGDIVASYEDKTQEKKLEIELRSSQHQCEQFMENMPANILIKDENLKIIYANSMANKFFKQENIVNKFSQDLLPPDLIKRIDYFDNKIIEDGVHEELIEIEGENNQKLVYRNLGFKIVDGDKVNIGIVSVDITEKEYLQKELYEKEKMMIAQSRHAQMGEMISMIAHQWRQPISVIAMDANNVLADIELEIVDELTLKENAEDIINQTQELSKTIDDFRDFFKPEKTVQEILFKTIVDDSLSVIGKSLENNLVKLDIKIDEKIKIKTYTRELMQVFINIIKNAKEILVENDIEERIISIISDSDDEYLKIKITDNGGGISGDNIEKIFDPYFSTKGEKNGTGLGLYMSKTIIEKHLHGTLKAYNIDNGACFEIKLPLDISSLGAV